MSTVRIASAIPLTITLIFGGCGTYVPEIQEFPGNALTGQQFVNSIVFNVTCEVRDAIIQIYKDYPQGTFMDKWGAQITLNLQIEEKSSANPTSNWIPWSPPSSVFNFGLGATGSADATRIDKISWFMAVPDVRGKAPCGEKRPNGVFLLESDLKLKEWLRNAITSSKTGNVDFSQDTPDSEFKQNVLSHEVKFEVATAGNVTPGWKLSRLSINQTGTGLTASRDRTHDLTITFGPAAATKTAVKDSKGNKIYITVYGPTNLAVNSHLVSEIGLAVSNGIKSSLPPPGMNPF
jgi:hypothetical protein